MYLPGSTGMTEEWHPILSKVGCLCSVARIFGWKICGRLQKQSIRVVGLGTVNSQGRPLTKELICHHENGSTSWELAEMETLK